MAHDKRLKAAYAGFDKTRSYPLEEAIGLIKNGAKAKFDETVEISLALGIDPRHADQMVRGLLSLPRGTGKTLRVGVFRPRRQGRRGARCRRRRGRCRRPRRKDPGRRDRLRSLHRHPPT